MHASVTPDARVTSIENLFSPVKQPRRRAGMNETRSEKVELL